MIFEATLHPISIALEYLPAIVRRLMHSRDIGRSFDFLTWFEFAPKHKPAFDDLVFKLRQTKEWSFVERGVDIRLEHADVGWQSIGIVDLGPTNLRSGFTLNSGRYTK